MNKRNLDHRWFGWLSWGCFAIALIVLGRNFFANDGFEFSEFSNLDWVLLGVAVIGEVVFKMLKNRLKYKDD